MLRLISEDGVTVEGKPEAEAHYGAVDLTGITGDLTGVSGDLTGITGDLSDVWGDLSGVCGDLTGVYGDLTGVHGDLSGVCGDLTGVFGDLTGVHGEELEVEPAVEDIACVLYIVLLAKRLADRESTPPRDMPNVFARSREGREAGISKAAFAKAQEDLLDAGKIEIVMSNKSRQLVIV
jgi:hypothetical protein